MRVTWTGALRSARAANRPARPPPTITTRREPDASAMGHPDLPCPYGLCGPRCHRGRTEASGHRPDHGIAGDGLLTLPMWLIPGRRCHRPGVPEYDDGTRAAGD